MKKSRTFRKSFVAAIAALCLVAPLTVMPVSAYEITITQPVGSKDTADHTYGAYQIFSGDFDGNVLSNINWGAGIKQDDTSLSALISEIQSINNVFSGKSTASDIAKVLGDNNTDTSIATKFAEVVGKYLSTTIAGTSDENGKISNLGNGYYLIKDQNDVTGMGSKTCYILQVAGKNETVNVKSAVPTIVKKVQENTELEDKDDYTSGSGKKYDDYNDVADYNIGDDVPFLDDGTLPSDFDSYDDYYYQIVDTPGDKFTPNITDENGIIDKSKVTVTIVDKDSNGNVVEKEVWVDGNNVKIEYVDTDTDTDTTPDTIKVTFKNINDIYEDNNGHQGSKIDVDKNSHVTIEYTAKLDEDAVIGLDGQESKVELNFSNDPNEDYESTTDADGKPDGIGTTPEDKVIVFTYELDVLKKLADSNGTDGYRYANDGEVGFKLYRMNGETKEYAKITNGKVSGWTTTENSVAEVTTKDFKVIFSGLDDGTYWLKETGTPAGYNSIEDYKIVIDATTENGQNWNENASTALIEVDLKDKNDGYLDGKEDNDKNTNGKLEMTINNEKGSSLPSTGGIGTTIFYLGGGTMAAVAGVYLITKKRMKNEEDDEI